jgi:hypothetical protein
MSLITKSDGALTIADLISYGCPDFSIIVYLWIYH